MDSQKSVRDVKHIIYSTGDVIVHKAKNLASKCESIRNSDDDTNVAPDVIQGARCLFLEIYKHLKALKEQIDFVESNGPQGELFDSSELSQDALSDGGGGLKNAEDSDD